MTIKQALATLANAKRLNSKLTALQVKDIEYALAKAIEQGKAAQQWQDWFDANWEAYVR